MKTSKLGSISSKTLQSMSFAEFCLFAEHVIASAPPPEKSGIAVRFPYDLRASMDMKKSDCSTNAKWTAFLNNSGTLCHVVSNDGDIQVRILFYHPIKSLDINKQARAIASRVQNWIVM